MSRAVGLMPGQGLSEARVQALIDAAAVNPYPYIQTYDPLNADFVASGAWTANDLRLMRLPRLNAPMATTNATIFVGTSSGNGDIAVYQSADNGTTMTRVASTGSVALSGTNAAFTTALVVDWEAGVDYWAGIALDNATATLGRLFHLATGAGNATLTRPVRSALKGSSFPAPADLSSLTVPYGSLYWVLFD